MAVELIGLGKFLKIVYSSKSRYISLLRDDIRKVQRKQAGLDKGSGGDFYGPFWADAKRHVAGNLNLRVATPARILDDPKTRTRLYQLLEKGFLLWWEEKRRLRNEPFKVIEDNVRARYFVDGSGVLKVENTLSITIGDDGHRIIYPYFCENPNLSEEAARVGLWVMSQCIDSYKLEDMRLLDVFTSRSFSTIETKMKGNEKQILNKKYIQLLNDRDKLRKEY